jgi:toxin-antitoxin system PIN domain toxin
VKLPDANVLVYALDDTSAQHQPARIWLETALSGQDEEIGFAWAVLLAVVRLTTKPAVFERPLSTGEAFDVIEGWLSQPPALVVHPTVRHAHLLRGLLEPLGGGGNLTSDAHLAALAIEYGGVVCSCDTDFSRFAGLRWENPLDGPL